MSVRKPLEKSKAIALRKRGYSYNEICRELHLSKSTCSLWLRNIKLNEKAIRRLVDRQDEGYKRAALTLRQYREERDAYIQQKVTESVKDFVMSPSIGKLLCATLYWAEGGKSGKGLYFANSDPKMISVYMNLLRSYFLVENDKFRALLHLHGYHDVKKQRDFWSKVTDIPLEKISIYHKPNTGKNTRLGYPGCISIRYHDIRLAKEMKFLYDFIIQKLGGVV